MRTEFIFATLLAAAAFLKRPIQDVAHQAIADAYQAAKAYLLHKFGEYSTAAKALEEATAKPESLLRKAALAEAAASAKLSDDAALEALIDRLACLLLSVHEVGEQHVQVRGHGNRVQVAGHDLITTERIVRRNTITPDDRHLTVEQRDRVRGLLSELAARLGGRNERGGIAAAHAMLQRRFQVTSYLLIPRQRYEEVLNFLRQQRAIHRSRLRHRDPVAYANDLYRAIFAGARELGWSGDHVYRFATEKLGLKAAVTSLKALGPIQLKRLAELIQRELRTNREAARGGSEATK